MQRVGLPSVIVLAVFSWLLLVAPALAAPRVDGFADVPWGANVDQLKAVMDQRGATLQKQGPDRVEYLGTFANEPARLIFYFDKNIFYQGEAELLNAKGKDGWKPLSRNRVVSAALKAYAAMTTSASRGAVRDVTQLDK